MKFCNIKCTNLLNTPQGRVPLEVSLLVGSLSHLAGYGPLHPSNMAVSLPSHRRLRCIQGECLTKEHSGTGKARPPKRRHPHHRHHGPWEMRPSGWPSPLLPLSHHRQLIDRHPQGRRG